MVLAAGIGSGQTGRKERRKMKRSHHGGEDRSGRIRYDFSVNINPLGMPEAAKAALLSGWSMYENYPDDGCGALRDALSVRFGIDSGRIVCGNGVSDLIYRLCSCAGFRRVLLPMPAFSEYERALTAAGCEIVPLFTEEESGFVLEEKHISQISESFDALFLCNPGNPAGGLMEKTLIEKIVRRCEEKNVLLVADECFLDFVGNGGVHSAVWAARERKNVVVLKAFTKIFAMAGLRLGFALFGRKELARNVAEFGAPWQVSGPAQAAGLAVLGTASGRMQERIVPRSAADEIEGFAAPESVVSEEESEILLCRTVDGMASLAASESAVSRIMLYSAADEIRDLAEESAVNRTAEAGGFASFCCAEGDCCRDSGKDECAAFIEATAAYVQEERRILEEALRESGFSVVNGSANFILFRASAGLDELIAKEGFSVRNCSDYLFCDPADTDAAAADENKVYYRVAVRKSHENQLFLEAVRRCVKWL